MSTSAGAAEVASFLARVLEREGALAELDERGALGCLFPEELQAATGLPESATLRILGAARPGELALPLESRAVQWCLDSAGRRGRSAAARISGARPKARGVAEAVLAQFSATNCALRAAGTRVELFRAWVLEFRYEAVGEERSEGSLHVAFEPSLRSLSLPLASALLAELASAEPVEPAFAAAEVERAASAVAPHVRSLLAARLAPLRASLERRAARDAQRLLDYHETLLHEARKRARGPEATAALASKIAAIERQRDEKMRELAFRYSVEVRYALSSILEVSYPVAISDLVLLRRRREIRLALPWDPFLRGVPPIACPACGEPALAFHACDEAGHLTCAACASPCRTCERVTCRACHPAGCRACARA